MVVSADAPVAPDPDVAPDAADTDVAADIVDTAEPVDALDGTDVAPLSDGDAVAPDADGSADVAEITDAAAATDTSDAVSPGDAATETSAPAADAADVADAATVADADVAVPGCLADKDCAMPDGSQPACKVAACVQGDCAWLFAADGSPCNDGDPCTDSDVCLGGGCSQGAAILCDDGNPCTVDSCADGVCGNTPAAGACDDGNVCTLGDSCKGGSCSPGLAMNCEDGNVCTDNGCDPAQGCVELPNAASCTLLDLCQTGALCGGGSCHAGQATVCDDGNPCTNDLCDPQTGVCQFLVTTTPCDDGNACTLGDVCMGGGCQPGVDKNCADGTPCTADGCDTMSGACIHIASAGSCDDGSACTVNDVCADGACLPGAATDCDDLNACTDDACAALTGCTHTVNSQPCSVGDACELAQCQNGQCVTTGVKGCDDGNPCTTGTCVAAIGCVFTAVGDGQVCSQATVCVGQRTCAQGKCATGAKIDCSDGNSCTDDHCDPIWVQGCYWLPNAGPCEDGDLCTGQDFCSNGKCLPGTVSGAGTICDDGNACTDDSCGPTTGCTHVANGAACDDGNACTIFEQCASGLCQGGALATCEDGNSCTLDVCQPTTGACSWLARTGSCDDLNPCTIGEVCVGALCIGTPAGCDDGNPCSADACDVATGVCGHTAIGAAAPCDDADACTSKDTCTGLTCAGVSVAASVCSDGNLCTVDVCNPNDGSCTWTPAATACSDGNPCTLGDACSAGNCVSGTGGVCDDGNFCTLDVCNPASGACTFSPQANGTACDDGLACTAASACQSGYCAPSVTACTLFADAFDCGGPATGWALPVVSNTTVVWAIDQTPSVPLSGTNGCSLNYNDGVNYCGNLGFYCQVMPTLVATSPIIDATDAHGMPRLAFDTWYQLDGPLPGGTGFGDGKSDVPLVVLRDVASNQILDQFLLSKSISACNGQCQSVWRFISLDEPKVAGHAFRIELSLASPSNWGNQGKGWFVDNVKMTREFSKEICTNGIDDDGNGRVDCADPVCAGQPGC